MHSGRGRQAARDCAAIPGLLALLGTGDGRVRARAVGALHNLSCDPQSVRMTRRSNGIGPLVALLKSDEMSTCSAAAGTLQNLSREAASRQLIRQQGAVPLLAALLSASDLQAQLCATGALLNILGPVLDRTPRAAAQRKALGMLLSCALTLSMVHRCVFQKTPACAV
ncbi:hypothetical protein WJX75_006894 [Coccomyxa subellipsoidea]|uniref:ARM repeat-containing protein n=1 Tax=Coccomyxa subellipsoidea TaxID=248742 RepID=A0ABR2YL84_9CHLO